jgi:mevalonate kinase
MATVFLEVVLVAQDMQANGLLSRDEVEDPLSAALEGASLGEVTGGGGGCGVYVIDVEVPEEQFEEALSEMRAALRAVKAPPSTEIRRHSPRETTYRLD